MEPRSQKSMLDDKKVDIKHSSFEVGLMKQLFCVVELDAGRTGAPINRSVLNEDWR